MDTIITLNEHNGIRSITKSSVLPSSFLDTYEKWYHIDGKGKSFRFVMRTDNSNQKTMSLSEAVEKFNKMK